MKTHILTGAYIMLALYLAASIYAFIKYGI
jgi:hypothetical protein